MASNLELCLLSGQHINKFPRLSKTPTDGAAPITGLVLGRRVLPAPSRHRLLAVRRGEHVLDPGSENGEHLEAMARISGEKNNRVGCLGHVVDDKVRVLSVRKPAERLSHQRALRKTRESLGQQLSNLVLVVLGQECAVLQELRGGGNAGARVGVDVTATHGAQLEQVGLRVRFEEEAEIAGIGDGDATKR